jgi:hypothetical protein
MHDWTLVSIFFDWAAGQVILSLKDGGSSLVTIRAEGTSSLAIPQLNEWGPSVSVNEVRGPSKESGDMQALEIEMQSGDVIKVVATSFIFPPGVSAAPPH